MRFYCTGLVFEKPFSKITFLINQSLFILVSEATAGSTSPFGAAHAEIASALQIRSRVPSFRIFRIHLFFLSMLLIAGI